MPENQKVPEVRCSVCGTARNGDDAVCPACGSSNKSVAVTGNEVAVTSGRAGYTHESPAGPSKPRAIGVQTPLGARSESSITEDDSISLSATGTPDVGTKGEAQVRDILIGRLRAEGITVSAIPEARDDRGEDALLQVQGRRLTLQVTSIPSSRSYWLEASKGTAHIHANAAMAAGWLRDAILSKAQVDGRASTILAIDARHAGVVADQAVVGLYLTHYSSPATEFGFAQVWIIGPTTTDCARL